MVFSLSKLLRYSLDGSREQVTLEEDLGHLNNYLSILEMRFGSRFEYKINVAPECMQCLIPKLVLQPMIENSVKYGFGNQLNLHVELKAYIHEEKLMMICRDDGVGMSATMVEKLCSYGQERSTRQTFRTLQYTPQDPASLWISLWCGNTQPGRPWNHFGSHTSGSRCAFSTGG